MVRLNFNPVEGFTSASDFGDDLFRGGFPYERLRVGVPVFGPLGDRRVRSATLLNTPRRSRLSFSSLNQRSIRLSQELEVGVKCKCQRRRVLVRSENSEQRAEIGCDT